MGGILESISGAFADPIDKPPQVTTGTTDSIFDLVFSTPQLVQFFTLAAQSGQNPSTLLADFIVGGDEAAKQGKSLNLLPLEGGKFLDVGAMSAKLPELAEQAQEAAFTNFQTTYQKLSQIPALSSIFSEASGDTSAFNSKFGAIFESLAGAALGSAAPMGFLHDPTVQANVLGPTALNKAQFEKTLQQQAQAQALSLSGATSLPMFSANAGATGWMQHQPGVFNAAQLGFGASAQNAQNNLAYQGLQLQQYIAADQSLWNITSLFGKGGAMQTDDAAK